MNIHEDAYENGFANGFLAGIFFLFIVLGILLLLQRVFFS